MGLTGKYVQSIEHECDICRVRDVVVSDYHTPEQLPSGWQRIRHAIRVAGTSGITERSYEYCLDCSHVVRKALILLQAEIRRLPSSAPASGG
jgi:hypothetical protein